MLVLITCDNLINSDKHNTFKGAIVREQKRSESEVKVK